MSEYDFQKLKGSLAQIAEAMERLSPPPNEYPDFENNDAFVWNVSPDQLKPVLKVSKIKLELHNLSSILDYLKNEEIPFTIEGDTITIILERARVPSEE